MLSEISREAWPLGVREAGYEMISHASLCPRAQVGVSRIAKGLVDAFRIVEAEQLIGVWRGSARVCLARSRGRGSCLIRRLAVQIDDQVVRHPTGRLPNL